MYASSRSRAAGKWNLRTQYRAQLENRWPVGLPFDPALAWTPRFASTALWLDAADSSTLVGTTNVSQWLDKSGNGRHAVQPTAANQPILLEQGLNNLPVVRFDGSNDSLGINYSVTRPYSIFIVGAQFRDGITRILNSDSSNCLFSARRSTNTVFIGGDLRSGAFRTDTTPFIAEIYIRPTQVGRLFVDGIDITNSNSVFGDWGTLRLGFGQFSEVADAYIAELIILNLERSDALKQKIEGYLAHKWGLAAGLPASHPFKINPPSQNTSLELSLDPDARVYIQKVEESDGAPLEPGVRQAINNFFVGCKADGIWEAIRAGCLMVGAKTLTGALTSLKGQTPTNVGFTQNDYSRRRGLKGDAVKFLIANRRDNDDSSNNFHAACYITEYPTTSYLFPRLMECSSASSVNTTQLILDRQAGNYFAVSREVGAFVSAGYAPTFYGVERRSVTESTLRARETTVNFPTTAAATQGTGTWNIFSNVDGTASGERFSGRLAYYSLGSSLTLATLDARVNAYINEVNSALNAIYSVSITDPDVLAFIAAVETADAQPLEQGVRFAYNQFITGCKADGIWEAIKSSCLLIGARTLAGALTPLRGAAPTNIGFVAADYNRITGLKSDGAKYLNSNRANNADPQDNRHIGVFITEAKTKNSLHISCSSVNVAGDSYIYEDFGTASTTLSSVGAVAHLSSPTLTGYYGTSRSSATQLTVRRLNTDSVLANNSAPPIPENLLIFGNPGYFGLGSNARFSFYSLGESLNQALLEARVSTLVSTISEAI